MRRAVTSVLTGAALLALPACGSGDPTAPTDTVTASPAGPATPAPSGRLPAPSTTTPSPPPSGTAAPPTAAPDPLIDRPDVLAALQRRGGMCPDNPCGSSLVVTADGTWTRTGVAKAQDGSGELTDVQLEALRRAVGDTRLGEASAFDGTCPTAYDGQEVVVSWRVDGRLRTAASCTVEFPATDPLLRVLATTLEDLPRD
ncbi:hypothetical protein [Phycicoccus flavus]|uniref:DUF3558 domain-containing protein n=1 Tax=Phycicoccus flavus TaxID=2502783 RepID=A0A8T6R6C4_9MICO|nr:hypothetical protein [Phycicoccus flavus]NHA68375.1 hypothetical protein [Phycicoccus flavus]